MPPVTVPFAIDLEQVLAPIATENPSGSNLRYDPVYDYIRDLRREEDPNLPQGVWKTEPKRADWNTVAAECLHALEIQSKDLQVAAWLLEAWTHLHGFAGAAQGFRVMHGLCDSFWDDLHPRIRADDPEFRIGPINWLNDRLPVQLKVIPVTAPDTSDIPAYTLADWEKASQSEIHKSPDPNKKPTGLTFTAFQQSAMLTPSAQLAATRDEIRSLLRQISELDKLLDEKLGREAPGLMPVRSVVEAASGLMNALLRDRGTDIEVSAMVDRSGLSVFSAAISEAGQLTPSLSRVRSRAEAYQLLAEAADFLARTEPHSPAPHLIRRAITWGSMSLEQLLPELVRNQSELSEIFRLLNVNSTDSGKR